MRHFAYKNGELHAEDVPVRDIAAQVGTPAYIYSTATLERHFRVFTDAFAGRKALVAYSVKANSNLGVLATLSKMGAGADVVSGGELARALAVGIPGEKIVFSGVGKTSGEMDMALKAGIKVFNIESLSELYVLNDRARLMGVKAPIAFRVNPDVSAGGHEKISTGKAENKFGIAWSSAEQAYGEAASLPHIKIVGVDVHIGSQITELAPFETAINKVGQLIARLRAQGHIIQSFDVGGGLGIPYNSDNDVPPGPDAYGRLVKKLTADMDIELIFEPGRMVAGNAGILLSRVVYVKQGEDREFAILDAAMNDLIRPALYDAYHEIETVNQPASPARRPYDIVGPVCETGDTFAKQRNLPPLKQDDLVVFHSAGAYGAVLSSQYNTRPLIPEVMVKGDQYEIIRQRPTIEDILSLETIPSWLPRKV
jgi:diaminopimelate decarboxylase